MIAVEPGRPFHLGLIAELVGGLGEARELLRMASAERLFLAGLREAFQPVLADRLEHEQALVADWLEKAEVDERRKFAHLRFADRLSRLDRKTSREHREPRQQTPALVVEQVVTPFDRRAQSALALRRVAGAVS